ncbi:MAG: hypothetical protein KBB32_02745 [Spirochaetia bacterium]|nr:hypothetical protein [Spirochaetia bacterium]
MHNSTAAGAAHRLLSMLSAAIIVALGLPALAQTGLAAVAVPALDYARAVARIQEAGGVTSAELSLPLSDFSSLSVQPLDAVLERLGQGDPRATPLTDAMQKAFHVDVDGAAWINAYVAPSRLTRLKKALAEDNIPFLATPGRRSLSRLFFLAPLGLALYGLLRKPRMDKLYRIVGSLLWLPLLFVPGVDAAGAAAALTAMFLALSARHPPRVDGAGPGVSPKDALKAVWPYATALVILCLSSPLVLLALTPTAGAALLFLRHGKKILAWERRRNEHALPSFVPILPGRQGGKLGWVHRSFLLAGACILLLGLVPAERSATNADAGSLALEWQDVPAGGHDPLDAHVSYQAALTWGRLGEASWGSTTYTLPAGFSVDSEGRAISLSDSAEATAPPDALYGSLGPVLSKGRVVRPVYVAPGTSFRSVYRLDTIGALLYILSLVPVALAALASRRGRGAGARPGRHVGTHVKR